MNKINYDTFKTWVRDNIKSVLPPKYNDAEVEFRPVEKLGHTYMGMTVTLDPTEPTPTIDIDAMYARYRRGMNLDEILRDMKEIVEFKDPITSKAELLNLVSDYETARKNMFIRVCDAQRESSLLQKVPYKYESGLAITYHIYLNTGSDTFASTQVTNELLEAFDVSQSKLHMDALISSARNFPIKVDYLNPSDPDTFVITNSRKNCGASAIFYPGAMDSLAEKYGETYYILPVSVNEVVTLPERNLSSVSNMEWLVAKVNSYHRDKREILSYRVFKYSISGGFEKA